MKKRSIALLLAALSGCLLTGSGFAADVQIGDTWTSYQDPEVWADTLQIAWQDNRTGEIWIASIDPQTGKMVPSDGRGESCGIGESFTSSFNGPEWGISQTNGLCVYFTREDNSRINQVYRYSLAKHKGEFVTEGGNDHRNAAIPSTDPNAQFAAIGTLNVGLPTIGVQTRFENEPNIDRRVPIIVPGSNGPRWVPGKLQISTNFLGDGGIQIGVYDVVTRKLDLLTSGNKIKYDGRFFHPPEFPGKWGFWCISGDDIALYIEDDDGKFQLHRTFEPPKDGLTSLSIASTEPFEFEGHSYLAFAAGNVSWITPSDIFIVGKDWDEPVKVSSGASEYRLNPEVVVHGGKLFLYYMLYRRGIYEMHLVTDFLNEPAPARPAIRGKR